MLFGQAKYLIILCALILLVPEFASSQIYSTRDDIPADAPFKRASPEALAPAPPPGPRNVIAAPVESVDSGDAPEVQAVESQDLAPPSVDGVDAPKTAATIYEDYNAGEARVAVLRCLNKVTAKFQELNVKIGENIQFGRLNITPKACRSATEASQPEHAALLSVEEAKATSSQSADESVASMIFNGWILASSPSLNGLEHPVYDISLVRCKTKKPKS